ncbi:hypothetical protein HanHA300_Chr12g0460811 [Helianthus annuus]|nr:hypothetical protein HanHA300_Chr12g0460811 [Helianthus annuus]KAJ0506798.1 hypothetical protein HanHA89_Chr12g0486211 [Helianthus annuus]
MGILSGVHSAGSLGPGKEGENCSGMLYASTKDFRSFADNMDLIDERPLRIMIGEEAMIQRNGYKEKKELKCLDEKSERITGYLKRYH